MGSWPRYQLLVCTGSISSGQFFVGPNDNDFIPWICVESLVQHVLGLDTGCDFRNIDRQCVYATIVSFVDSDREALRSLVGRICIVMKINWNLLTKRALFHADAYMVVP